MNPLEEPFLLFSCQRTGPAAPGQKGPLPLPETEIACLIQAREVRVGRSEGRWDLCFLSPKAGVSDPGESAEEGLSSRLHPFWGPVMANFVTVFLDALLPVALRHCTQPGLPQERCHPT